MERYIFFIFDKYNLKVNIPFKKSFLAGYLYFVKNAAFVQNFESLGYIF
jgi:hypothetical protein